jgi:hypothetical protein
MEYLLKASAVIILFYLCFSLFLKRETFFQHNRWFLLTGLLIALVFPLLVIPIYVPIEPIVIPEMTYVQNTPSSFLVAQPEKVFDWTTLFPIVYGIGFAVFLIQFIFQFGSLASLLLKNPKFKDEIFTYVIMENKISPFSFFKWIVYNPESFEHNELDLILTHEKVHAKQLHSIDILLTQLACVFFWFNPLIWLYRKEVRQNLEYIADYKTQMQSNSQKEYQRLLVKTSVVNHNITLSNNFYNSLIKERIVMLKKSRSKRKKQFRYLLILPLLGGLLMSMNTETVYVETERPLITENNLASENNDDKTKHIEVVFNKEMSDKQLDEIKKELKSNGIEMSLKRLKRNSKGEISDINIDFKTEHGSANYNVKDANGIKPFYFKMNDESFGVGAIKSDVHDEHIIETIHIDNSKKEHSKHRNNVFILKDNDSLELIVEDSLNPKILYNYRKVIDKLHTTRKNDTIYFKTIDSVEVKHLSKVKTDFYYESDTPMKVIKTGDNIIIHQPNSKSHKKLSYSTNESLKPLIIVNGKEISQDAMGSINPNNIESVNVFKDKTAIESYGKKGENGVILIKLKNGNTAMVKSVAKEKNPWRVEVSSTTFIDDEDPSKNGTLAYITKLTSNEVLEMHKTNLKKLGIQVKYNKLKRNKAGEITSIKITIKNEKGAQSSASWKVDDGIPSIEFGETEGSLIARTSEMN